MIVRFFYSRSAKRSIKKTKHDLLASCETVKSVLALNPNFGVEIPKRSGLCKMRLSVQGLNCGKSGGYRLIYRAVIIDEVWHIVFLRVFFKEDIEDLSHDDYSVLENESEEILSSTLDYEWQEFPASH